MQNIVSHLESSAVVSKPPRRILVIFNPAAGRNRKTRLDQILKALTRHGASVVTVETTAPGHAEAIAREVDESRIDLIAAAGGDGTINEIVNGLRGKKIALGIIPLGTANVLADEIGLSRRVDSIARALAFGPLHKIHLGEVNGRRFTMMAGAGFDANVVSAVSLPLKKKLGPLAYVWQTMKQAFTESSQPCDVQIDGVLHTTASVVVCNGRHYGGPFVAAPNASLTSDVFSVILLKSHGWFAVLRYSAALVLGRLAQLRDVEIIFGREIVVQGVGGQPVQADGDIVAALPVHIRVDPEPIWLAFPATKLP